MSASASSSIDINQYIVNRLKELINSPCQTCNKKIKDTERIVELFKSQQSGFSSYINDNIYVFCSNKCLQIHKIKE